MARANAQFPGVQSTVTSHPVEGIGSQKKVCYLKL
jgi:hypothetical protein